MVKSAIVTGVTGQDGRYLSELLLDKGYEVHGIMRRSSSHNTERIDHLLSHEKFHLYYGDMTDTISLLNIIKKVKPDEIYNLAAQSHVKVSFETPEYTVNADGVGTLRLLEAIRVLDLVDKTKLYQASTSELFGKVQEIPEKETTPFYPRSPYGAAKLYAYWIVKNYRESYDIFAVNGILFNHESPHRGENFVSRKVTRGVAAIANNEKSVIKLGNLDAKRDWGHAKDYVEGMWLMLQQQDPDDYILATGKMYSVRDLVEKAFQCIGIEIVWQGEGVNEKGMDKKTGEVLVEVDSQFYRPAEVDLLIGDSTKAKKQLGWQHKVSFDELIEEMVEHDIKNYHSSTGRDQ